MSPYYGYYAGGGTNVGSVTTQPTLIQHVTSSANPVGLGESGNNFKFTLPNAVGAGNCLILGITYNDTDTATVTDNNGNTWPVSPAVSADSTDYTSEIFVLPNANAGVTTITVSFGSARIPFQYTISEFCNVATTSPVNGTASAAAQLGPSLSTGSFTPGNNNASGGNLIWNYYAIGGPAGGNPTSFVPGGSFVLLDGDIAWTNGQGLPHAAQYYVQATSAAINPGITTTGDSADHWDCVAIALKAASAGTQAPAGIRVGKINHFTTTTPPAAWKFQIPATGNLRVLTTANYQGITDITSVVDSEGNTWNVVEGAADQPYLFWWPNAAANPNLTVTVNISGGSPTATMLFWDVQNASASPLDAMAGVSSTNVNSQTTVNGQPPITPTQSGGLVIAVMGIGDGPGLGFNTGAPAGAIFDFVNYTGQTDLSRMDNSDCCAHLYNSSTAALNWNWTITSQASNSVSSTAAAFK